MVDPVPAPDSSDSVSEVASPVAAGVPIGREGRDERAHLRSVSVLERAIGEAAQLDLGTFDDVQLTVLVAELCRQRDRLTMALTLTLTEWDERRAWCGKGARSAVLRLAQLSRSPVSLSAADMARARRHGSMPEAVDAVLDGRLSLAAFELLQHAATPERAALFERDRAVLLEQCTSLDHPDARTAVRYWCNHADDELAQAVAKTAPVGPDVVSGGDDPGTVHDGAAVARDVSGLPADDPLVDGTSTECSAPGPLIDVPPAHIDSRLFASTTIDDTVILDGTLDAISGAIVTAELRRLVERLRTHDRERGVHRTPAQLRAAALVEMATRSASAPPGSRRPAPLFSVLVGERSFDRLCELTNGSVLRVEQLLPHIDTALVESILFDGPSTVISVSSRRTFTGALRRAIEIRDRRCQHRHAGCQVRAPDCDVDHTVPVSRGGVTSQFNGRLECKDHNRVSDLHDHDAQPLPERDVGFLDQLRARLRWQIRHGPAFTDGSD